MSKYTIALVQNQSEMTHYTHADCRAFLNSIGYSVLLFTATNIDSLEYSVCSGKINALLIASNALKDKAIRSYFISDTGKKVIEELVSQSAGILILMQYQDTGFEFSFLPEDLSNISIQARPGKETSAKSTLIDTSHEFYIPFMRYPNKISLRDIENRAKEFRNLGGGVYWHWWTGEIELYWNVHISCENTDIPRPLIISSKEHLGYRIVMSALPIDWHQHNDLFENILSFVVEGRHRTAIIRGKNATGSSFEYFIATLTAKKEGFRIYQNEKSQLELYSNIKAGIHTVIVLDLDIPIQSIIKEVGIDMKEHFQDGRLRIISFEKSNDFDNLVITGRQSPAKNAFRLIIPLITADLQKGYLDGSFWSTISGLQAIEHLPGGLDFNIFPVDKILEISARHDREGSYDEVFGATVALLWLRSKVLENEDALTKATVKWIRLHISEADESEKIKAYTCLSQVNSLMPEDADEISHILESEIIISMITKMTEIELFSLLEAAVHFEKEKLIVHIINELGNRLEKNPDLAPVWIDIPTTASFIYMLVDGYNFLNKRGKINVSISNSIKKLIVPSMIFIESSFQISIFRKNKIKHTYPWDGNAVSTLRCFAAWYAFDKFLTAPVYELAETVKRASKSSQFDTIIESSLDALRGLVHDRQKLDKDHQRLERELKKNIDDTNAANIKKDKANANNAKLKSIMSLQREVGIVLLIPYVYLTIDYFSHSIIIYNKGYTIGASLLTHTPTHFKIIIPLILFIGGYFIKRYVKSPKSL